MFSLFALVFFLNSDQGFEALQQRQIMNKIALNWSRMIQWLFNNVISSGPEWLKQSVAKPKHLKDRF